MIRGKRYRGQELEIKHVLTCLASPQERGLQRADRHRRPPRYLLRKSEMIGEDDGQPLVVTLLDSVISKGDS